MEGRLRADLVERLRETTATADLVIAMGTSLSGVMADQLVSTVGRRAAEERGRPAGKLAAVDDDEEEHAAPVEVTSTIGVVIIVTWVGFEPTWPYPCKPEPSPLLSPRGAYLSNDSVRTVLADWVRIQFFTERAADAAGQACLSTDLC